MEFEKEFDLAIPDEQAEKITTVGEAIKHIQSELERNNINNNFLWN